MVDFSCSPVSLPFIKKLMLTRHIFFPHAGTIISQDEIDHFTCHQNIPADILPTEGLTPADVLKMILNTDIKVDEVMLFNRWR